MATFGQIAHAIQDFSKTISDDVVINIDHIIFLMSNYRNYLLSQPNKKLTQADYQDICVNVSYANDADICGGYPYLVSNSKVPKPINKGAITIAPPAGFRFGYRFQFVSYQKFMFLGYNKWLHNIVYATIGPDGRMYIRGSNDKFQYLTKVRMTAIFDDVMAAAESMCDDACCVDACDIEDKEFPLDAAYVPLLMKYVTVEVTGAAWQPKDDENNANDDLARFAQALSKYTNTAFKRKAQGAENKQE